MSNPFINGNINVPEEFILAGDKLNLKSAESLFKLFLHNVKKQRTIVVTPEEFRKYINVAALEWVKSKLPLLQFNQKRIDDLQILHIDTDGVFYPMITTKGNSGGDKMLFVYPKNGLTIGDTTYPPLLHGISAEFKINYVSSPCHKNGVSDLIPAKYLKTDARAFGRKNTYTMPKDERLYFEIIDNYIRLATGATSGTSQSYGHSMRLEYYRYPKEIVYDLNPDNVQDSEFDSTINLEIIDKAVLAYLERLEDVRLQSNMLLERNREQYK